MCSSDLIILDSAGECIAWGSGAYRQQIYDVNDNLIWDHSHFDREIISGAAPGGTARGPDARTYHARVVVVDCILHCTVVRAVLLCG